MPFVPLVAIPLIDHLYFNAQTDNPCLCTSRAQYGSSGADQSGRTDRAHTGRRKVLARLKGDRRRFRQLVKPHVPEVVAPKRIGLGVFAEQRSLSGLPERG